MDQIKIGKFIQKKRKEKSITQSILAEKLGVTDRSVSKWENGICMPDTGIMPELCEILDISINDLFSGEVINMKNNEKKLEENLLELAREKEQKDKQLLTLEWVIGYISSISFFVLIFTASFIDMDDWIRILLMTIGFITFIIGMIFALRIEQVAGYYECKKCHHKYIPKYFSVFMAPHIGRTRYMKCPKCNEKSWNKKIIK